MKQIIMACSLLLTGSLLAQDYQYQAELEEASKSGFHQVDIGPEVFKHLNPMYSDLRVLDEESVEQPYFIQKEAFEVSKRVFKEYRMVEKVKWTNGATVLFIENTDTAMINNIQLQIKNFDVRKRLELAGSDDYKEWYAIKENYVFYQTDGKTTTSEVKGLYFPFCDYRYYRIIIYDWYSMPINVLKVGYFDTYHEKGLFTKLDTIEMQRVDNAEDKKTYIKLKFNGNPYFDKLVVSAEKPTHFYRRAQFALKQKDYKGREYFEPIAYFLLNSNSELTYFANAFRYQDCYLIIDNNDNPPLEGIRIEAYQLKHRLIAHFEEGKNYQLVFGSDSLVSKPVYDIVHYKDQIKKQLPTLKMNNIEEYSAEILPQKEVKSNQKAMIWVVVVVIASLLGFISYSMISEMDKK